MWRNWWTFPIEKRDILKIFEIFYLMWVWKVNENCHFEFHFIVLFDLCFGGTNKISIINVTCSNEWIKIHINRVFIHPLISISNWSRNKVKNIDIKIASGYSGFNWLIFLSHLLHFSFLYGIWTFCWIGGWGISSNFRLRKVKIVRLNWKANSSFDLHAIRWGTVY